MGNLQKKNMDLLHAYRRHTAKKKTAPIWAKLALPPLVLLLFFASIFVYSVLNSSRYQRELKNTETKIAALKANGTGEAVDQLRVSVANRQAKAKNLQQVLVNLETYPKLRKDAIDQIVAACKTTVTIKDLTFDGNEGTISITAQTPYIYETSDLITRLKNSGAFSSVSYDGYAEKNASNSNVVHQGDESDKKTDEQGIEKPNADTSVNAVKNDAGFYEMHIICVLKAGD